MDSDYLVTQKIIKDGGFIIMIQDAFEHENVSHTYIEVVDRFQR